MTLEQARVLLADELEKLDGDGVNLRLCIEYVLGTADGEAASTHDKRKLNAALHAIVRAGNSKLT